VHRPESLPPGWAAVGRNLSLPDLLGRAMDSSSGAGSEGSDIFADMNLH
jgi:hypothetical protein